MGNGISRTVVHLSTVHKTAICRYIEQSVCPSPAVFPSLSYRRDSIGACRYFITATMILPFT